MTTRLQRLLLALVLTALAGGAMAQTNPSAPNAPNAPTANASGTDQSVPGGPADGDMHRQDHWGHGWHRRPDPDMMGARLLMRSLHRLNLTAAQRQQVRTILSNARAQFEAQRSQPSPQTDRLALANPGDPAYASAVQAAEQRATDRIQQRSELNQQLYDVLTADQKTQFATMLSNWKARMAQRSEGPRGQPGPVDR